MPCVVTLTDRRVSIVPTTVTVTTFGKLERIELPRLDCNSYVTRRLMNGTWQHNDTAVRCSSVGNVIAVMDRCAYVISPAHGTADGHLMV